MPQFIKTFDIFHSFFFFEYFNIQAEKYYFQTLFFNILMHVANMYYALSISKAHSWVLKN